MFYIFKSNIKRSEVLRWSFDESNKKIESSKKRRRNSKEVQEVLSLCEFRSPTPRGTRGSKNPTLSQTELDLVLLGTLEVTGTIFGSLENECDGHHCSRCLRLVIFVFGRFSKSLWTDSSGSRSAVCRWCRRTPDGGVEAASLPADDGVTTPLCWNP